ncbi:RT_RNaseH domain-containing protein, partial [Trichonephila clavipes]
MLEARDFTVFTDHKPLTYAFRQRVTECSPRQIRQLDFISVHHKYCTHSGSDNIAADVLSRVSAITFPSQIDYDCIAETQQTDQELHPNSIWNFLGTQKLPQTKNETPATVEPNATASTPATVEPNATPATVEHDPTASTPTQPSTRSGRKVHLPT